MEGFILLKRCEGCDEVDFLVRVVFAGFVRFFFVLYVILWKRDGSG